MKSVIDLRKSGRKMLAGVLLCALMPCFAYGLIKAADDLDEEIRRIKASETQGTNELAAKLDYAERILGESRKYIGTLDQEIKQLEKEKIELRQLQTALTSGLIAAVLGGIVATLSKFGSRAERDMKRLEVIAKVAELREKKVGVPSDIVEKYNAAPKT